MATFNGMDYAIFVLLFLSVAIGVARGFIKEVISLIAWVAAFVVSTLYAIPFAIFCQNAFSHAPASASSSETISLAAILVSYLVLFFGVLVCGSIVKALAGYLVEGGGLGFANRFFGAIFGLARGTVIVLLILFFLTFTAITTHSLWKDSKLVAIFHPGVKWLNQVAQPYLGQIEAKMKKAAKNLNQEDLSDIIKAKPVAPLPVKATSPVDGPVPSAMPQTVPETR